MKIKIFLLTTLLAIIGQEVALARPNIRNIEDLNFKLNLEKLRSNTIYLNISTFTPSNFRNSEVSELDITHLSELPETEMLYIKSIFKVPHKTSFYNEAFFANMDGLKRIYDTNKVQRLGATDYSMTKTKYGIDINFNLSVETYGDLVTIPEKWQDIISIVNKLDSDNTTAAIYQVMYQHNFSIIFDKTITVNKLIPFENETVVISYSIGRAEKDIKWKLIDKIPGIRTRRFIEKELKKSIVNTFKEMSR